MELLLLGGTAFVGREIARVAVARGHRVACLARGSAPAPDGSTFVVGDRDAADGLAPVTGRRWDCVIDVATAPGQVRRAVAELDAAHWVYVSSTSVYTNAATFEQDEDAPVAEPLVDDVMPGMELYGAAKVACEQTVRSACTSGTAGMTATIVRPGLIGGPGDLSGRSGYWPWRLAHPSGDDVIVPDDPEFPCALIDVRDLAEWVVTAAERWLDGVFNATGPTEPLRAMLGWAAEAAGADGFPVLAVPAATLAALGVTGWAGPASLPLWIDDPEARGLATLDTGRARAAGLVTRPVVETFRGALAFEAERTSPRKAGLSDEDERRVRDTVASSGGERAPFRGER